METLEANSSLWTFDANSGLQPSSCSWESYPLDGYMHVTEENTSDSDSSLEAPAYNMYFNPVNVDEQNGAILASYGAESYEAGAEHIPYGWSYDVEEQSNVVVSPGSTSDSSTTQSPFMVNGDSSDETSQLYEEDDSMEDSDESYGSSHGGVTSPSDDIEEKVPVSASGRPLRGHARGEGLKQVHDMIRQVNSAVDTQPKVVKVKTSVNPKKRSRVEPDIRCVTLTRDQLLTMTSEELDEFTARLKADHPLTTHELREIKRQRRLIKNREYAQASRVKKKVVLSDLGVKFQEIENERDQLIQRVNLLENENAILRAQLDLPPSDRKPLNLPRHSNTATKATSDRDVIETSPPRPKRRATARSSATSVATIGGGVSLFAIVLFALAVYSGVAQLPFSFGAPPSAPSTASHTSAMNFQSTDSFNTFRTMDILGTQHEDPLDQKGASAHHSDDPSLSHPATLPLDAPTSFSSNIVTMDDLLASEDIIFATNNFTTASEDSSISYP